MQQAREKVLEAWKIKSAELQGTIDQYLAIPPMPDTIPVPIEKYNAVVARLQTHQTLLQDFETKQRQFTDPIINLVGDLEKQNDELEQQLLTSESKLQATIGQISKPSLPASEPYQFHTQHGSEETAEEATPSRPAETATTSASLKDKGVFKKPMSLEESIQAFEQSYPDAQLRGGYILPCSVTEVRGHEKETIPKLAPQPTWRNVLFKEDKTALREYFRVPRYLRVDPRFLPIKRRQPWPETQQTTDLPNWPVIPSSRGWTQAANYKYALDDFFGKYQHSVDATVRQAAINCKELSFLSSLEFHWDSSMGPLCFNPNTPFPSLNRRDQLTVARIYYRAAMTASQHAARVEEWQRTQWLPQSSHVFGPLQDTTTLRAQAMDGYGKLIQELRKLKDTTEAEQQESLFK